MRSTRRQTMVAATILAIAGPALVSAPGAAASTPRPVPPRAVSPAPSRCPTSHLRARLLLPDAGAGQRYLPVQITNAGGVSCTLHGFGGFGLLDGRHRPLPALVTRDGSAADAHTITLRPGRSAVTVVHYSALGGASPADYTHPAFLVITPPDAVHHVTVAFTDQVFQGRLDSHPYTASR